MIISAIVTSVSFIVFALSFMIHVHIQVHEYYAGIGVLLAFTHIWYLFYFFSLFINNLLLYLTITLNLLYIGYYPRYYAFAACKLFISINRYQNIDLIVLFLFQSHIVCNTFSRILNSNILVNTNLFNHEFNVIFYINLTILLSYN